MSNCYNIILSGVDQAARHEEYLAKSAKTIVTNAVSKLGWPPELWKFCDLPEQKGLRHIGGVFAVADDQVVSFSLSFLIRPEPEGPPEQVFLFHFKKYLDSNAGMDNFKLWLDTASHPAGSGDEKPASVERQHYQLEELAKDFADLLFDRLEEAFVPSYGRISRASRRP